MKYTPLVQAWVRWNVSRDDLGEIFTLDPTYGVFEGGLDMMHSHSLALLLARILQRDGPDNAKHPTATIRATVVRSYAIGTMRRRADTDEDVLLYCFVVVLLLCCRAALSCVHSMLLLLIHFIHSFNHHPL